MNYVKPPPIPGGTEEPPGVATVIKWLPNATYTYFRERVGSYQLWARDVLYDLWYPITDEATWRRFAGHMGQIVFVSVH